MKTYGEVLEILKANGDLYVPVFYITGTYEWLKVDKDHYIHQITNPYICDSPFPCYIEVESDGEMFMHPKTPNK
jgi:hypothetical protein